MANALIYLLATLRPPNFLFEWWIKKAQPFHVKQKMYPRLNTFFRFFWLCKRGLDHLYHMDFARLPGEPGYILYKLGIIKLWKKNFVRKYKPRDANLEDNKPPFSPDPPSEQSNLVMNPHTSSSKYPF